MQVILLENVGKLGKLGEQVTVKAGYARNFLFPRSKAVMVTKDNLAMFESRRAELEAKSKELLSTAQARGEKLEALASVTIQANAGDEGKLFGSIGARDIADAITAAGAEVKKSEVKLPEGVIRNIGEYEITVQLHSEVMSKITITVVSDK